jgi:hypothetical protein
MAYPAEEDLDIAETKWNRVGLTQNPKTGDRILTRTCDPKPDARKASVVRRLNEITTVTDPRCDNNMDQGADTDVWDVVSCGWDGKTQKYIQVLRLPAPWDDGVAGYGTTAAEDLYGKTEEKTYFDQATIPTITRYAVGVLRTVQAQINALKRWTVSVVTKTSTYSLVVFPIRERVGGGTQWHYVCRNQRGSAPDYSVLDADATHAAPEAAGMIRDFAGAPTRNEDGTWNWHIVYRQDDSSIYTLGAEGEKSITKYSIAYRAAVRSTSEASQYYNQIWHMGLQIAHVVYYRVYATSAEAWAATRDVPGFDNDGQAITVTGHPISAPPQRIGEGLWQVYFEYQYNVAWWWDVRAK